MKRLNSQFARFAAALFLIGGFAISVTIRRLEAAPRKSASSPQEMAGAVSVDPDNIGGVVTSANGPEAGVWVIAETLDFQTKMRKIVVTDDRGRFLLPALPKAKYKVWVRGYGLVDSLPTEATIGQTLSLKAVLAPNPQVAAQYFPPNYWLSMLDIPAKDQFPMRFPGGGDKVIHNQGEWIDVVKTGCQTCHQMGDKITREMPKNLGTFPDTKAAWERRILSSQVGGNMLSRLNTIPHDRAIAMFADWTDRITAGEVPPTPPRPAGMERNVVLTLWDVATPKTFLHSEVSTNRWNPHVNPNGPVYNGDWSGGTLVAVDPQENTASTIPIPLPHPEQRKDMPTWSPKSLTATSPYWGDELIWDDPINPKNTQIDKAGKLWVSVENRPPEAPNYCKASAGNVYAKAWQDGQVSKMAANGYRYQDTLQKTGVRMPWESPPGWGLAVYDPKTGKFESIDLCFGQSHAVFANDKDETLYFSLRTGGLGWFKTQVWNKTHDTIKSQGWCPAVIDYNGDGKTGQFTVEGDALDPKYDRLPIVDGYGMGINPVDGSVWYTAPGPMPGRIVRAIPGANPPSTCATEVYEPPYNNPKFGNGNELHYTPRGIDVDTNGIVWTALAGSGDLASFDRRKCKVLIGPTATGQHCPDGWTMYPIPGPGFKGTDAKADWHYVNWTDRMNTFGLGVNTQVVLGTGSDSLLLFRPETKEWLTVRVPYPMGLYTRDIDGRIDDPKSGWKGRGLWASTETRVIWHAEGGKGQVPQMVHFQIRPDPLAK
jgi:streptogramin lyase